MASFPPSQYDFEQAITKLAQEPVIALEIAGAGANSKTYRVTTATRTLALKCYPTRDGNTRDRLWVEWQALKFLRDENVDLVPSALAYDEGNRLLLMEWIEGQPVAHHSRADLDIAISFMSQVLGLSDVPNAAVFPSASQACLSASEIVKQINERLAAFAPNLQLEKFIDDEFDPRFQSICAKLKNEIDGKHSLPSPLRRLIPADFGFHNALRETAGKLRFFDFDYFGWDDPVKLVADFLLHPAMSLSQSDKKLIIEKLAAALPQDEDFRARLGRHKPLYALRWVLILLNPLRRDRQVEQRTGDDAYLELVQTQLTKARLLSNSIDR